MFNFLRLEKVKKPNGPDDFSSKKLNFEFKNTQRFWNGGDIQLTHYFNVFAVFFPSFERLFILILLQFRKKVKGHALEKAVNTFLCQEAHHDHQIRLFSLALVEMGYPVHELERSNTALCKAINRKSSPMLQLSMTMATEYFISLLSDLILRESHWLEHADPEIAALWRWHSIEEIEHKSVAYDVYHFMGGGYTLRCVGMMIVMVLAVCFWSRVVYHLARTDKLALNFPFWFKTLRFYLGRKGLVWKLLPKMLGYYRPSFHPWNDDNRILIQKWKDLFQANPNPRDMVQKLGTL